MLAGGVGLARDMGRKDVGEEVAGLSGGRLVRPLVCPVSIFIQRPGPVLVLGDFFTRTVV